MAAPHPAARPIAVTIDDQPVEVPEGSTILDACRKLGIDTPTLCYGETLMPANACRICVVELEGARTLVPACSRKVEPDMVIRTNSDRVRHSRKMVIEFLASSVDLSITPAAEEYLERYDDRPERYGPPAPPDPTGTTSAPATTSGPTAKRPLPSTRRRRSTTTCTCAITRSASFVTSASTRAASSTRTRSRSRSPVEGSTPTSRPSTPTRCPIPPASTAATASPCARPGHLCSAPSTTCGRPRPGTSRDRPRLTRSAPTAAWAATSPSRAGQPDRQGDLSGRSRHHPRQPVHQGPLRIPAREPQRLSRGAQALRFAVTSISIFIRGSASPTTSIVLAGLTSPKYSRNTGQQAGKSSAVGSR